VSPSSAGGGEVAVTMKNSNRKMRRRGEREQEIRGNLRVAVRPRFPCGLQPSLAHNPSAPSGAAHSCGLATSIYTLGHGPVPPLDLSLSAGESKRAGSRARLDSALPECVTVLSICKCTKCFLLGTRYT
jgi:hypothetical protein